MRIAIVAAEHVAGSNARTTYCCIFLCPYINGILCYGGSIGLLRLKMYLAGDPTLVCRLRLTVGKMQRIITGRQHSLLCRWPAVLAMAQYKVVRLSVRRSHSVKTTQARMTKSSLWGPWMDLLPGSVNVFYKFEWGHFDRGKWMREFCTRRDVIPG